MAAGTGKAGAVSRQARPSFAVRLRNAELNLQMHIENLKLECEYVTNRLYRDLKELATEMSMRDRERKRK